jgi:4-hydroxy-tetrahydrodipicolinate synthase
MNDLRTQLQGLWLPLITPFRDGKIDSSSLHRLVRHFAAGPIDGLILAATSGEGLLLSSSELERLVDLVRTALDDAGRQLPICLGLAGASTAKLCEAIDESAAWPIDGYLISSPYYLRPSQRGLQQHFTALADHASWPVMLYNIPYRSAVAMTNETLLALAEHPNIVGLKDCCADRAQTIELIRHRPAGFRVLTGEDAQYHDALTDGADGAILLSAHVETDNFAAVMRELAAGNRNAALAAWQRVRELTRLLFTEPSPAPAKHWLWRLGLIDSPEVRSPMVAVSDALAAQLDHEMARRGLTVTDANARLVNPE